MDTKYKNQKAASDQGSKKITVKSHSNNLRKFKKTLDDTKQPAGVIKSNYSTNSREVRDTEDLKDEIKSLKYRIAMLSAENQSLKSRCRQLNEGIIRKEKELANLMDPAENAKLLQTLGDNRPQTVRMFRQLHQKLFKMEGQLKEKEEQYNRLITDLKYTRVEELRLQLDTAFSEIERLQSLTNEQSNEIMRMRDSLKVRTNKKKSDPEFVELIRRVKTLGQVIKTMDEQKKELTARNEYLIGRMQNILNNDHSAMKEIETDLAHLEDNNTQDKNSEDELPEDCVLVAKMVESKLSEGVRQQYPVARPVPVKNDPPGELGSIRSRVNSLESSNQKLRKDVSFYKKQLELTKIQLDHADGDQSSVKTYESSPRLQSPRKAFEQSVPSKSRAALSKEDHSAILIQRAWRAYRTHGLAIRQKQKALNMHDRAVERDKEVATKLLKSAVQGHLSRESSMQLSRQATETEVDDMDSATFCTEEEENVSVLSEAEKNQMVTNLKAAIRGNLEVEKSLTSLQSVEEI